MSDDILLAKLGNIERCLLRIRTVTHGDPSSVREIDVQDIVVLNLQRAIQAAVDLASHVIAERGLGLPDSLKDHFRLLCESRVVDRDLGLRLQAMVGFRNIAIHDYRRLDVAILETIVRDHLVDLEQFAAAVVKQTAGGA